MPESTDLLQGTLDLLILKTLAVESMHGWGVAQRIQQLSKDVLQVGQGSLYPALYRLEYKGWIRSEWGNSDNNRRAKFYRLTATVGNILRRNSRRGIGFRRLLAWCLAVRRRRPHDHRTPDKVTLFLPPAQAR